MSGENGEKNQDNFGSCDESEDEWKYMQLKEGEGEKNLKNQQQQEHQGEKEIEETSKNFEEGNKIIATAASPLPSKLDSTNFQDHKKSLELEAEEKSNLKEVPIKNINDEMNTKLNPDAKEFIPCSPKPDAVNPFALEDKNSESEHVINDNGVDDKNILSGNVSNNSDMIENENNKTSEENPNAVPVMMLEEAPLSVSIEEPVLKSDETESPLSPKIEQTSSPIPILEEEQIASMSSEIIISDEKLTSVPEIKPITINGSSVLAGPNQLLSGADEIVSQSPRKGAINMENILIPDEKEFRTEIHDRPAESLLEKSPCADNVEGMDLNQSRADKDETGRELEEECIVATLRNEENEVKAEPLSDVNNKILVNDKSTLLTEVAVEAVKKSKTPDKVDNTGLKAKSKVPGETKKTTTSTASKSSPAVATKKAIGAASSAKAPGSKPTARPMTSMRPQAKTMTRPQTVHAATAATKTSCAAKTKPKADVKPLTKRTVPATSTAKPSKPTGNDQQIKATGVSKTATGCVPKPCPPRTFASKPVSTAKPTTNTQSTSKATSGAASQRVPLPNKSSPQKKPIAASPKETLTSGLRKTETNKSPCSIAMKTKTTATGSQKTSLASAVTTKNTIAAGTAKPSTTANRKPLISTAATSAKTSSKPKATTGTTNLLKDKKPISPMPSEKAAAPTTPTTTTTTTAAAKEDKSNGCGCSPTNVEQQW